VDCPSPFFERRAIISYVSVPLLETSPIFPFMWIGFGIIPIFDSPGDVIPGQFGPMSLVELPSRYAQMRIIS
jgi:hypothetical protein